MDLGQGTFLAGDIAQAEGHGHAIETTIRKRQCFGIQLAIVDAAHEAAIGQPIPANPQHGVVDVADHHLPAFANPIVQEAGNVAGTTGQIEHLIAAAHPAGGDKMSFPQAMDAKRHEVVHHVVVARHRAEHFTDQPGLVVLRNFAESEMGRIGFVHGLRVRRTCIVNCR